MIYELDEIDKEILRYIQDNPSHLIKQLAMATNLPQSSAYDRFRRLKNLGFVTRDGARLNKHLLGLEIEGYIHLRLLKCSTANLQIFKNDLLNIKGICSCICVSGRYNIKLKVVTANTSSFFQILNRIASLDNVRDVEDYIWLEDIIEERGLDF